MGAVHRSATIPIGKWIILVYGLCLPYIDYKQIELFLFHVCISDYSLFPWCPPTPLPIFYHATFLFSADKLLLRHKCHRHLKALLVVVHSLVDGSTSAAKVNSSFGMHHLGRSSFVGSRRQGDGGYSTICGASLFVFFEKPWRIDSSPLISLFTLLRWSNHSVYLCLVDAGTRLRAIKRCASSSLGSDALQSSCRFASSGDI